MASKKKAPKKVKFVITYEVVTTSDVKKSHLRDLLATGANIAMVKEISTSTRVGEHSTPIQVKLKPIIQVG